MGLCKVSKNSIPRTDADFKSLQCGCSLNNLWQFSDDLGSEQLIESVNLRL